MRVRVTDVDQYAYYLRAEDMPLEDLLRRLRREEPPSEKMRAGTAFHSILEDASATGELLETAERDGFRFRFDVETEIQLPVIRELPGTREYLIDGMPVTLSGKVDAFHGLTVYDHKLTGQFNAETYGDAFQWRAYLAIFGADIFRYNAFVGREEAKSGEWVVKDYHPLPFYRYPDLEKDVERQLGNYVRFARDYLIAA